MVFVPDAAFPTALAVAPDGRVFFAERSGAIKVVDAGGVRTLDTVPTATAESGGGYNERGLLGLALSPTFSTDHLVYVYWSRPDYTTQVVERFRECNGAAGAREAIITLPAGDGCCHKGGRIAFGPDGKLYVTVGDQHAVAPGEVANPDSVPQNPADLRGKILRYEPDGSVPGDNPFGAGSAVWAAGFRNPYGLAFGNGTAFVTDNGPTGDLGWDRGMDLAMVVPAGARFQWPACAGYSHPTPGATDCVGGIEPDWSSEEGTVVPTGAAWIDESGPAPLAGHFVFCTLNDGMLIFTPGDPHATVVPGPSECKLDVAQGPDHAVYYSDEQAVYRFAP